MQADSLNRNANYIGKFPEYKPVSRKKYEIDRENLINLLFDDNLNNNNNSVREDLVLSEVQENGILFQNKPNPFSSETVIGFELMKNSYVIIPIYNSLGKKVALLGNKLFNSGKHEITFNKMNLKTGIYYYSLKVNGINIDSKKMIIY